MKRTVDPTKGLTFDPNGRHYQKSIAYQAFPDDRNSQQYVLQLIARGIITLSGNTMNDDIRLVRWLCSPGGPAENPHLEPGMED